MKFLDKLGDENNKKAVLVLGIVVMMIVILALITYLFFYESEPPTYDNSDIAAIEAISQAQAPKDNTQQDSMAQDFTTQDSSNQDSSDEVAPPPILDEASRTAADSTKRESVGAESTRAESKKATPNNIDSTKPRNVAKDSTRARNTITALKYAIVPNNADIFICDTMRNGKWDMPKSCGDSALEAVQKLIDDNNELIAIEVSGIVDSNPYAGPSAELKQEGLASFRAREAMGAIVRAYSNVAVFEGISMQENNKRGFQIKAYYLKK